MKPDKKTETKATKQSPDKVFEPQDYDKLRGIICGLDPADAAHWNRSGGPDMNYLKESMGRVITLKHIQDCGAGKWTREVAQEMADKKAVEKIGGGPIDPESAVSLNSSPEQDSGLESADDADSGTAGSDEPAGPVVECSVDHKEIMEEFPAPAETELERQKREREEAREKRLQNEATGANIHDERSLKVREQAKALQKLDREKAKKEKQAEKDAVKAEEKRKAKHAERVAVEPSLGEFSGSEDAEARYDNLERVTMTLVKVLLDMSLSPVLRSKVLGCDKLIRNLSDED